VNSADCATTPCIASATPIGCASRWASSTTTAPFPLHPLLVGLINDYRAWREPTSTGLLVERDDHQPFDRRTIHRYVQAAARRAGVGRVHPHQLRHTLATQCLNRGMSLEAIAALLGHRSPRMTLVYARIADTVVADQYFNATSPSKPKRRTWSRSPTSAT
jgi:integrase